MSAYGETTDGAMDCNNKRKNSLHKIGRLRQDEWAAGEEGRIEARRAGWRSRHVRMRVGGRQAVANQVTLATPLNDAMSPSQDAAAQAYTARAGPSGLPGLMFGTGAPITREGVEGCAAWSQNKSRLIPAAAVATSGAMHGVDVDIERAPTEKEKDECSMDDRHKFAAILLAAQPSSAAHGLQSPERKRTGWITPSPLDVHKLCGVHPSSIDFTLFGAFDDAAGTAGEGEPDGADEHDGKAACETDAGDDEGEDEHEGAIACEEVLQEDKEEEDEEEDGEEEDKDEEEEEEDEDEEEAHARPLRRKGGGEWTRAKSPVPEVECKASQSRCAAGQVRSTMSVSSSAAEVKSPVPEVECKASQSCLTHLGNGSFLPHARREVQMRHASPAKPAKTVPLRQLLYREMRPRPSGTGGGRGGGGGARREEEEDEESGEDEEDEEDEDERSLQVQCAICALWRPMVDHDYTTAAFHCAMEGDVCYQCDNNDDDGDDQQYEADFVDIATQSSCSEVTFSEGELADADSQGGTQEGTPELPLTPGSMQGNSPCTGPRPRRKPVQYHDEFSSEMAEGIEQEEEDTCTGIAWELLAAGDKLRATQLGFDGSTWDPPATLPAGIQGTFETISDEERLLADALGFNASTWARAANRRAELLEAAHDAEEFDDDDDNDFRN